MSLPIRCGTWEHQPHGHLLNLGPLSYVASKLPAREQKAGPDSWLQTDIRNEKIPRL